MVAQEAKDPFDVAFMKLEDARKVLFDIDQELQSWEREVAVADTKVKQAKKELIETIQKRDVLEEKRAAALDRVNLAFDTLKSVVGSERTSVE